jgi:hypothetical protein
MFNFQLQNEFPPLWSAGRVEFSLHRQAGFVFLAIFLVSQRVSRLRTRQGGMKTDEVALAPLTPSASTTGVERGRKYGFTLLGNSK